MKPVRITCNFCGKSIRDDNPSKWDHIWKHHPQVPLYRLMGLFLNPVAMEQTGEFIGNRIMKLLKG